MTWRLLGVLGCAWTAGLALAGEPTQSTEPLFSGRDARLFERSKERGLVSQVAIPLPRDAVLVFVTQTSSGVKAKAMASPEVDGATFASLLASAVAQGSRGDVEAQWSIQDEGVVAVAELSAARLFASSSTSTFDVEAFTSSLESSGFKLAGFLRASVSTLTKAWRESDDKSSTYAYFSLEKGVPAGSTTTCSATLVASHWFLLAVFALLPFVGCTAGLFTAVVYAKRSKAPAKRKRKTFSRLALYPTFGSILVHFPLFIYVMMSGALRPVAEIWLGSTSLLMIFAPAMLVSILPLGLAAVVTNKAEAKLFKKPEIDGIADTQQDQESLGIDRRQAELLYGPKWMGRARLVVLGLLILSYLLTLVPGLKWSGLPPYIVFPTLAVVILLPALAMAIGFRQGASPDEATMARLRSLVTELGGNPERVKVDTSAMAALHVNGSATPFEQIKVTSRAIEVLNDRELKVLLAHELAHLKFNHPRRRLYVIVPMFVLIFVSLNARESLSALLDPRLAITLPFVLLMVFFGVMMTLGLKSSRENELKCDRAALEMTRDPEGMLGVWKHMWAQSSGVNALSDAISTHPSLLNRFSELKRNSKDLGLLTPQLEATLDEIINRAENDDES